MVSGLGRADEAGAAAAGGGRRASREAIGGICLVSVGTRVARPKGRGRRTRETDNAKKPFEPRRHRPNKEELKIHPMRGLVVSEAVQTPKKQPLRLVIGRV